MSPGRNSPCPCGSGKKYKQCCLDVETAASAPAAGPTDPVWHRMRALLDGYPAKMMDFVVDVYGPLAMHEAWDAFMGADGHKFDAEKPVMQLFMPWFFNCWSPDPIGTLVSNKSVHKVIPTAAYLSARGRLMDPLLRRYLESLLTEPISYFDVLDCDPGVGMTLRDVMTREERVVTERGASRTMRPGDILLGQLASVGPLTMLEASNGFAIPPQEKAQVISLRAQIEAAHPVITPEVLRDWDFQLLDLFHVIADRLFNPLPPTLLNTDGDPLSPHKLTFDLTVPPQVAFNKLKHLALDDPDEELLEDAVRGADGQLKNVRFVWKMSGNKQHAGWDNTLLGRIEIDGAHLTAEVNSAARAATIRKKIEKALGQGVRYRASEIQTTEDMLAEMKAGGDSDDDATATESERMADIPELRAKISAMMAAHWEQWVDTPLPILRNRTPQQAVKDVDEREIVESLIIQGERANREQDLATDEEVFRRLRERLGLPAGRGTAAKGSIRSG